MGNLALSIKPPNFDVPDIKCFRVANAHLHSAISGERSYQENLPRVTQATVVLARFNAWHSGYNFQQTTFGFFFLLFPGNRIWHFIQIVSTGDNLHKMSNLVFWGKIKKQKQKTKKHHQFVDCWICPESIFLIKRIWKERTFACPQLNRPLGIFCMLMSYERLEHWLHRWGDGRTNRRRLRTS